MWNGAKPLLHTQLTRVARGCLLCVGAIGLSGCQNISLNGSETAEVRFVDASVDAPALDLYVNGTGAAYSLANGTFSSYVGVIPGTYQIVANRTNTGQALVNARASLAGAHQYTAVVSNHLGSLQENVYPDVAPVAVPGTMSVRVLNAADGGLLDVYLVPGSGSLVLATPVVSNLSYTGASGYEQLPADRIYSVVAVPAGVAPTTAKAVTVSGITVTGGSGAVRTVVLSDLLKTEGKIVSALVLDDSDTQ